MTTITSEIYDSADSILDDLLSLKILPQGGGILFSEMLLFFAVCKLRGVQHFVESGRRNGYSTQIIASWCRKHGGQLESVEHDPIPDVDEALRREYSDVANLVQGDGMTVVPYLSDSRSGVLLDGPKGLRALRLLRSIDYRVGAVHDVHRYCEGGGINETRTTAESMFPSALYSDDPEWVERYGHHDEPFWIAGKYTSRQEMVACGFTLMVLDGRQP